MPVGRAHRQELPKLGRRQGAPCGLGRRINGGLALQRVHAQVLPPHTPGTKGAEGLAIYRECLACMVYSSERAMECPWPVWI
jgi:hypothetical protein